MTREGGMYRSCLRVYNHMQAFMMITLRCYVRMKLPSVVAHLLHTSIRGQGQGQPGLITNSRLTWAI